MKVGDDNYMSANYVKQWTVPIGFPMVDKQPKLSIDEQIEHLSEEHGVCFNIKGKDAAKEFLINNNYYHKLKAYSKNFSTYENKNHPMYGKFCDLDFEYLVELSVIDMYLRRIIITMSLNIEHFLKVQLINDITNNEKEDAYNIVDKYITNISAEKEKEISNKINNYYCNKYNSHTLKTMPAWELVEILSFGDFINFYELYYSNYPNKKSMKNNLKPVQWLRNAAAHNNCIINDLTVPTEVVFDVNERVNHFVSQIEGISKTTREKKMSNRSMHDLVVMLYVFDKVISSKKIKRNAICELKDLVDNRMLLNKQYFSKNSLLQSNYNFFKKIVDYFADSVYTSSVEQNLVN